MAKKAKLHEVLAVDRDLEQAVRKILQEATKVFNDKHQLFIGQHRRLEMFADNRKNEEAAAEQFSEISTTVADKLDYISTSIVKHYDAVAQKERTNQNAKADVVINGNVILESIPATVLLGLENKLSELRKLYNALPTLQQGHDWKIDETLGNNVYKLANPEVTSKTEKKLCYDIIVPATKEHPAQVKEWTEDRPVGKYVKNIYCGMITPARKSVLLGRIDVLIAAVKKARARANQEEIVNIHIGKKIWDYINA